MINHWLIDYDQTQYLVDQYTPDTLRSHQCGSIAQSVQQIGQQTQAVLGKEIGDERPETIRSLNNSTICTYAAKAIQELNDIVKKQQ